MHTLFNITTTLLLLPFGGLLATLSEKILPEKDEENDTISLQYIQNVKNISEEKFGLSAIAMESTKNEIMRMLNMASENVKLSLSVFKKYDKKQLDEVDKKEEYIDFLNKEISKYISKIITHERTEEGSKIFNAYFAITSNIERISDHAVNIAGYSNMLSDKKISLSDMAKEEIDEIQAVCQEVFDLLLQEKKDMVDWHGKVACMEQKIDDLTKEYRENMYKRIREGVCKDEGSILFSEMLTDTGLSTSTPWMT
jgi:phosphate:Na+ symporter